MLSTPAALLFAKLRIAAPDSYRVTTYHLVPPPLFAEERGGTPLGGPKVSHLLTAKLLTANCRYPFTTHVKSVRVRNGANRGEHP